MPATYTHGKFAKATYGTGSTLATLCGTGWVFTSTTDTDDVSTTCDDGFGRVTDGLRRGRLTMTLHVNAADGVTISDGDYLSDVVLLYHKDETAGWAIDEILVTSVTETWTLAGKGTVEVEAMTNGSYERTA